MIGALVATVALAAVPCPTVDAQLVLVQSSSTGLAAVGPQSSLLTRAPKPEEKFDLFGVEAQSASVSFALHQQGRLRCRAGVTIAAEELRSPATGKPAFDPVVIPSLIVARGSPPPPEGSHEESVAYAFDVASLTEDGDHVLPTRLSKARATSIAGGTALCSQVQSTLWSSSALVCGLLLRAPSDAPPPSPPTALAATPGEIRDALDDREDTLRPGGTLAFGESGWGRTEHALLAAPGEAPDPGRSWKKALLAHGVAVGLSGLSVALSFTGKANCRTWCDDAGPLPGDSRYLDGFRQRSVRSIENSGRVLQGFDYTTIAVGFLSTLIPSARRGRLSRLEIIEDMFIISEGVVVSWTTPLTVQRRLGRAQPRRLHGGFSLNDRHDLVAPPLQAIRVNRASAIWGAATLLLFLEDASPLWTFITGTTLGALTLGVGVTEVRAGYAFPWDVPLSIITGLINGAGTVMWHQLFWPGWPGGKRGSAPLRIRGINVQTSAAQTQLGLSFSF